MASDERTQYLNWTPEEWVASEQGLFNVHPLQLQLMRMNSCSVLMEVKTRLAFLAVSRGRKWQMYRTMLALPSTYTTHTHTHTHTLNPKALQGSVSSGAKNPSWGNPTGSSTLPAALPSNPIGSENPESACSTSGRRTGTRRGALVLFTGTLHGAAVPAEVEQLGHAGRFRDFTRPSCVQTH